MTLLQEFWRYRTVNTTRFNTMGTPAHSAAAVRDACRERSMIGWNSEICICENILAYENSSSLITLEGSQEEA
jgi:hypothetical protein